MASIYYQDEWSTIWLGDCRNVFPVLPTFGLIVTDPPYYRVKKEAWDNQWKDADKFLQWIGELCDEFKRLLLPNGSLYVFASPEMTHGVEGEMRKRFKVLNNIRWAKEAGWHNKAEKESLREYLSPYESVIFAEQFGDQYEDSSKALHKEVYAPLGRYIQTERERCGLTRSEVEIALGFVSKSEPTRGTALCYRWEEGSSLPTKETYEKLRQLLNERGNNGEAYLSKEYEDLRREYEDLRRPFNLSPFVPYTDTWSFATVSPMKQKHPCEKPVPMMRHILQSSSREGMTVLDPFMGAGSTLVAAKELRLKCIGIEREERYCEIAARRLQQESLFSTPQFVQYSKYEQVGLLTHIELKDVD